MYRRAREKANLSREEAAFRANIGTRTLAKYEAGETTPPADVVLRLAEVYNDLDLISAYCSRECAIGRVFRPKVKTADIAVSTLRLLAELKDVNDTIDRLVQIVSDGHVSTAEMDDFRTILIELCDLHREIERMKMVASQYMPLASLKREGQVA